MELAELRRVVQVRLGDTGDGPHVVRAEGIAKPHLLRGLADAVRTTRALLDGLLTELCGHLVELRARAALVDLLQKGVVGVEKPLRTTDGLERTVLNLLHNTSSKTLTDAETKAADAGVLRVDRNSLCGKREMD